MLQPSREVTVLVEKLTRCQELIRKLAESELGVQLSLENAQEFLEARLDIEATYRDSFLEPIWTGDRGASQQQDSLIPTDTSSTHVADCSQIQVSAC